jgi:hypothetical protein
MLTDDLLDLVQGLSTVEYDTLDRDRLAEVVAAAGRVRGWLDTIDLQCSRRGRTLADQGRCESAPALIARLSGRTGRDAEQITRRDRVAEAMPAFEDALADGAVTSGHLDAIVAATRSAPPDVRAAFALHEHELLALATADTVDTFHRRCKGLVSELVTEVTGNDADELERQRAAVSIRTWVDHADGLHHTHAALDPLRHEVFWTALNRSIRRRQQQDGNARTPWNQLQADALVDAVTGAGDTRSTMSPTRPGRADSASCGGAPARAPSPAADIAFDLLAAIDRAAEPLLLHLDDPPGVPPRTVIEPDLTESDLTEVEETEVEIEAELRRIDQRMPEISALVDVSYLVDELHAHGIRETEDGVVLPVSTIRRLCCDAEIIPVVLGGDGVALDVGRGARTVTRSQRRALRAMHRTCINRDCNVPFSQTKAHHIRWWVRDRGPTDIDNLAPLCDRCHHLVHEGGWTLTMTPDRVATWIRPDGTIHHTGPTVDRGPPGRPPPTGPAP